MVEPLQIVVSASRRSASQARGALSRWLLTVCGPTELCDLIDDVVFSVSEAVTNCVEHAYRGGGGPIRISGAVRDTALCSDWDTTCSRRADRETARTTARTVSISVSDDGRWRRPADEPGHRGRGLQMIEQCVTSLMIHRRPDGTTLTMTKRLAC